MKKTIQAIGIVVLALLISTADSWGQTTANPKKLIADQTETQVSGTKNFRLITSNDKLLTKLMGKYESKAVRQTISYKKDRLGRYKEVAVYFPVELRNEIELYVSK